MSRAARSEVMAAAGPRSCRSRTGGSGADEGVRPTAVASEQ